LDTFDFHLIPSLNKNRVLTLAQGEFVKKHQNVLMVGNSGTGNYRKFLFMERNKSIRLALLYCSFISFHKTSQWIVYKIQGVLHGNKIAN
jgi:hypothetical protein